MLAASRPTPSILSFAVFGFWRPTPKRNEGIAPFLFLPFISVHFLVETRMYVPRWCVQAEERKKSAEAAKQLAAQKEQRKRAEEERRKKAEEDRRVAEEKRARREAEEKERKRKVLAAVDGPVVHVVPVCPSKNTQYGTGHRHGTDRAEKDM